MMFALGFSYMNLIVLKKLLSFPSLLSVYMLIFKYGKFYFFPLYLIPPPTLALGNSFLHDATNMW